MINKYLQNDNKIFEINSDIEDNINLINKGHFKEKRKINYSKKFMEKYKNNWRI